MFGANYRQSAENDLSRALSSRDGDCRQTADWYRQTQVVCRDLPAAGSAAAEPVFSQRYRKSLRDASRTNGAIGGIPAPHRVNPIAGLAEIGLVFESAKKQDHDHARPMPAVVSEIAGVWAGLGPGWTVSPDLAKNRIDTRDDVRSDRFRATCDGDVSSNGLRHGGSRASDACGDLCKPCCRYLAMAADTTSDPSSDDRNRDGRGSSDEIRASDASATRW